MLEKSLSFIIFIFPFLFIVFGNEISPLENLTKEYNKNGQINEKFVQELLDSYNSALKEIRDLSLLVQKQQLNEFASNQQIISQWERQEKLINAIKLQIELIMDNFKQDSLKDLKYRIQLIQSFLSISSIDETMISILDYNKELDSYILNKGYLQNIAIGSIVVSQDQRSKLVVTKLGNFVSLAKSLIKTKINIGTKLRKWK